MFKLLFQPWINALMPSFFGIGQGPTKGEYQEAGALGGIGSFATSTGEGDISSASDFWKSIISGDPSQLARVLGPAYSGITNRGNERIKTLNQFATRSGGTGAAQQHFAEDERAQATDLEGSLLGGAASSLGSMGSGLLGTGLSAHEAAFSAQKTIQEQKAAKWNDIFKSISSVASSFLPGGAFGKVGSKLGGNFLSGFSSSSQPSDTGNIGDYSASGAVG